MKAAHTNKAATIPNHQHTNRLIRRGYKVIAGVDEVGRGAWAGPVVAAAVILAPNCSISGVKDSKLLNLTQRQKIVPEIKRQALAVGIGWVSSAELDRQGLAWAVMQSGIRALDDMRYAYDAVILDGHHNYLRRQCYAEALIKADQTCLNVAAASIIAKVARDNYMKYYHSLWPQFGWHTNVGYGTGQHQSAIRAGISPLHRRSFKPIAILQTAPPAGQK